MPRTRSDKRATKIGERIGKRRISGKYLSPDGIKTIQLICDRGHRTELRGNKKSYVCRFLINRQGCYLCHAEDMCRLSNEEAAEILRGDI